MKDNKILKLAFVLLVICAVTAGILGVVNVFCLAHIRRYFFQCISRDTPSDALSRFVVSNIDSMYHEERLIQEEHAGDGQEYVAEDTGRDTGSTEHATQDEDVRQKAGKEDAETPSVNHSEVITRTAGVGAKPAHSVVTGDRAPLSILFSEAVAAAGVLVMLLRKRREGRRK